ncbi:MAG: ATP-binding protein [Pseudomonadota bacterium]
MIRSLRIQNFYSFKNEQFLNLEAGKAVSNDDRFIATPSGTHIAKVVACFGANASGKTNLLKVFPFLEWFITSSWDMLKKDDNLIFSPFLFQKEIPPTTFEIETESASGALYRYEVTLTNAEVLSEKLYCKHSDETKWKTMFLCNHANAVRPFYLSGLGLSLKDVPRSLRRKNASLISALGQLQTHALDDFVSTINFFTNVTPRGRQSISRNSTGTAIDALSENPERKQNIEEELQKFDIGISKLLIEKIKLSDTPVYETVQKIQAEFSRMFEGRVDIDVTSNDENYVYTVKGVHIVNDEEYTLPLDAESNGTQNLLGLLNEIEMALESGGIAVYDEIEHGLHPHILPRLFELFYDENRNPKNAQLICTCHSANVMQFLHKKQIYFAEKNSQLESELFSLDDFKKIRNDDNYVQKYLTGAYGAVPRI